MNKSTNSDSIYRAVVEVLTNNYTANLFSSLQRENLAKKVSHKISSILSIDGESQDVATHMGDQIIKNENNTKDGLTKEKADKNIVLHYFQRGAGKHYRLTKYESGREVYEKLSNDWVFI